MEKVANKIQHYQDIILAFLRAEAEDRNSSGPHEVVIADKEQHHYQLLYSGWLDENRFVHQLLIHLHIKTDGKVWLLENRTETRVAEELVRRGIPNSEIVLGFHPAKYRQYTGYAAA